MAAAFALGLASFAFAAFAFAATATADLPLGGRQRRRRRIRRQVVFVGDGPGLADGPAVAGAAGALRTPHSVHYLQCFINQLVRWSLEDRNMKNKPALIETLGGLAILVAPARPPWLAVASRLATCGDGRPNGRRRRAGRPKGRYAGGHRPMDGDGRAAAVRRLWLARLRRLGG